MRITDGERQIFIGTRQGMGIRFSEKDVRPMGRDTTGVIGVTLKKDNDDVVEMDVVDEKGHLLSGHRARATASAPRSPSTATRAAAASGVINVKVTEKNGPVVGIKSVTDADQLLLITQSGMLIRIKVKDIRETGRAAQGVRRHPARERRPGRRRGEAGRARRHRRGAAGEPPRRDCGEASRAEPARGRPERPARRARTPSSTTRDDDEDDDDEE